MTTRDGCGEDADPLAGLDAEIDQPAGDLTHDLVQLGERDIPPLAIAACAHRGAIAEQLDRLREQVGDRLRRGCRRRGGDLHDCSPSSIDWLTCTHWDAAPEGVRP